jgi:hypothetical protein
MGLIMSDVHYQSHESHHVKSGSHSTQPAEALHHCAFKIGDSHQRTIDNLAQCTKERIGAALTKNFGRYSRDSGRVPVPPITHFPW